MPKELFVVDALPDGLGSRLRAEEDERNALLAARLSTSSSKKRESSRRPLRRR
jgi:hypothetical protein